MNQVQKRQSPFLTSLKRFLGPIFFLGLIFAKSAKYLFAILKFGKLGSLLTIFISVWVYSRTFGWPFAAGFVLLIFIHELGHALVLRREGIAAGFPVFIPFVGAFISMRGSPRNAWVEAKVGIGGPLLGSLAALFTLGIALETNEAIFFALAKTGFLINLFNMIPVSPMDGGRILGAVSKWSLIIGLIVGAVVYYYIQSPILLIMLLFGSLHAWQTFKHPVPGYYEIPLTQKFNMGLAYTALLIFLFWGLTYTLPFLDKMSALENTLIYSGAALFGIVKHFFVIPSEVEGSPTKLH